MRKRISKLVQKNQMEGEKERIGKEIRRKGEGGDEEAKEEGRMKRNRWLLQSRSRSEKDGEVEGKEGSEKGQTTGVVLYHL